MRRTGADQGRHDLPADGRPVPARTGGQERPLLIGVGVVSALMVFAIVTSAINNSTPGGPVPPPTTATAAPAVAAIGQCVADSGIRVNLAPVPCNTGTLEVLDVASKSAPGKPCELSKATTHTAEYYGPAVRHLLSEEELGRGQDVRFEEK